MSISVDINNVTYTIPTSGETGWGAEVTAWINAASQGLLQKKGGTFTLTGDTDFGDNFGFILQYLVSKSAGAAQTGVVRLANGDNISWRNNANDGDLPLSVSSNDLLQFNGVEQTDTDTAQTLKNKTIDCLSTDPDRNFILNCLLDIFEAGVVVTTIDETSTDDQIATAEATREYVQNTIVGSLSGNTSLVGNVDTDYTFNPTVGWDTDIYFSVNNASKEINTVEAVIASTSNALAFTPTNIRCSSDGDVICVSNPTENANQGIVAIFRASDSSNIVINGGSGEEAGKQISVASDGSLVTWSQGGELRVYNFSGTFDLPTGAGTTSYGDNEIFTRTNQIVTTSYDGGNNVVVHRWDFTTVWTETTSTSTLTYNKPFVVADPSFIYLNDSEEIIRYDGAFTPTSITSATQDIVGGLGIDDAGSNLFTITEVGDLKFFTQLLGTEENVNISVTPVTPVYLQGAADGQHCAINANEGNFWFSKDTTWYAQEVGSLFCFSVDSVPFVNAYTLGTNEYVTNGLGYLLVDNDCLYIDGELTGSTPTVRTVVKDDIRNVENAVGRFIIVRRVDDHTYWDNSGKYTINVGEKQQFGFIPYQRASADNDGYISSNNFISWQSDLWTGLYLGGDLSVNASDNTTFDLRGGTGLVVDTSTDPTNPTTTFVFWQDSEANVVTNIGTQDVTYISVDVSGNIFQTANQLTEEQQRDYIFLGVLVHPMGVISTVSKQTLNPLYAPGNTVNDFALSVGNINTEGNVYDANAGANLKIDKSQGQIFRIGANYFDNKKSPNLPAQAANNPVDNFFYTYKDAVGWQSDFKTDPNNNVDPDQYNIVGTGLVPVTASFYTIQRIYLTTGNITVIFYGQAEYATEADAISAINSEQFEVNPDLRDVILRSYMIIKQGETNTDNTTFISAGKFGGESTTGASTATTTLQAAYDNSSRPQIELNGGGGFQIIDNATPISDPLFEVQDNVETKTYLNVTPDGVRQEVALFEKIGIPADPSSGFTKIYMDTNDHLTNKASSGINVKIGDDGDFNSGMSLQQPDPTVSSDGVNIKVSLEAVGGGDIDYYIGEEPNRLDCTPPAEVFLFAGSATSPITNYVWAEKSATPGVAQLKADTAFPSGEFCWVGQFAVQDAVSVQTNGALSSQRFSDHVRYPNGRGIESHQREKIRVLGADWDSGVDTTLTITTNAGSADNVTADNAAGIVYQLHRQDFPAFNNPGTDIYYVVNDSTTAYRQTTDLNTELTDTLGNSMVDRSFNLVMWAAVNKSTGECKRFINLPFTSYASGIEAIIDSSNTTVTAIPAEFKKTGFLIARFVLTHSSAASGTWTNEATVFLGQNNIDFRGLRPGYNLNQASTPSLSEFSDGAFRVNDDLDSTKQFGFQCENISTGTLRIATVPDASGNLVLHTAQETLTSKIYDGGTAGDATNRTLVPQAADDAALAALTPSASNLVYKTDENKLYVGNGSSFDVVGGGLIPVEIDHTFGGTLETGKHYIVDLGGAAGGANIQLNLEAGAVESIIRVSVYNIDRDDPQKLTLDPSGAEQIRYDDVSYDSMELGQIASDCWVVWDSGEGYWVGVDGSESFNGTFSGTLSVAGDLDVPDGNISAGLSNGDNRLTVDNGAIQLRGTTYTDFSDYWGLGSQDNIAMFYPYGVHGTIGAFRMSWSCNGYRNSGGTWTYMGINGNNSTSALIDLDPTGQIIFGTGTAVGATLPNRMQIDQDGNVAIGAATLSTYRLRVATGSTSSIFVDGGITVGTNSLANTIDDSARGSSTATLYIGNQAIQTSCDKRLKRDIGESRLSALKAINQIPIYDFCWADPSDSSPNNKNARGRWTGLLAQEAVKFLPFIINAPRHEKTLQIDYESDESWTLDTGACVNVLFKAVQELTEENDKLHDEQNHLRVEIAKMRSELNAMRHALQDAGLMGR